MPIRIQRRRTRGWRKPDNCVYVGRPSKWGNPYKTAEEYQKFIDGLNVILLDFMKAELRGKNLMCWCSLDKPCHADILLKEVNK